MSDAQTTLEQLKQRVRLFSRERDWEQFHHPKDLGIALACEVGELLDHLRYRSHDEIRAALAEDPARRAFAQELADCLWLLLRMAYVIGIDLATSLDEKLDEAGRKYPVERCKGRPDKYTSYRDPGPRDA